MRSPVVGTILVLLVLSSSTVAAAAVEPQHGRIAFIRDGVQLKVMNADGSQRHLVYAERLPRVDRLRPLGDVTWSPTGRRLAVAVGSGYTVGATRIVSVRSDGSRRRKLGEGSDPAWSPDGTKIAFMLDGQVWTMDPDGGDRSQITDMAGSLGSPVWLLDGERISFDVDDDETSTWVVNADGSDPHLAFEGVWGVAWSPDGSQIAYPRWTFVEQPDTPCGGYWFADLIVANADGSEARVLPSARAPSELTWAPDGSAVAYTFSVGVSFEGECDTSYGYGIAISSLDASAPVALTDPYSYRDAVHPSWTDG